ncbi:MAG: SEL1-like repeat protein, partial [Bacteroidota bacterium]
ANQGLAEAEFNLGEMYKNGYGVAKDYKKAAVWYQKAIDQGHEAAEKALLEPIFTNSK